MKRIVFMLMLLPGLVHAAGKKEIAAEIPSDYITVQAVNIRSLSTHSYDGLYVMLPYVKPQGVTEVFASTDSKFRIDSFIVDGFEVKTARTAAPSINNTKFLVPVDEAEAKLEIYLEFLFRPHYEFRSTKQKYIKTDVHTDTRRTIFGIKNEWDYLEYRVPVGAKEAYLTYRVVFPDERRHPVLYGKSTEPYTVHWKFDWPESFGWGEEVKNPDEYITVHPVHNWITVGDKKEYSGFTVMLPYIKPEGVTGLYEPFERANIRIDSFIVDRFYVKMFLGGIGGAGDRDYFFPPRPVDKAEARLETPADFIYRPTYESDNGVKYVEMKAWQDFYRNTRVVSQDNPRKSDLWTYMRYRVPFGAKDAYLTYRVVFPDETNYEGLYGVSTEPYTVHWKFDWPE